MLLQKYWQKLPDDFHPCILALGSLVRPFARNRYFEIENIFFWKKNKRLNDRVEKDLQFRLRNINTVMV